MRIPMLLDLNMVQISFFNLRTCQVDSRDSNGRTIREKLETLYLQALFHAGSWAALRESEKFQWENELFRRRRSIFHTSIYCVHVYFIGFWILRPSILRSGVKHQVLLYWGRDHCLALFIQISSYELICLISVSKLITKK